MITPCLCRTEFQQAIHEEAFHAFSNELRCFLGCFLIRYTRTLTLPLGLYQARLLQETILLGYEFMPGAVKKYFMGFSTQRPRLSGSSTSASTGPSSKARRGTPPSGSSAPMVAEQGTHPTQQALQSAEPLPLKKACSQKDGCGRTPPGQKTVESQNGCSRTSSTQRLVVATAPKRRSTDHTARTLLHSKEARAGGTLIPLTVVWLIIQTSVITLSLAKTQSCTEHGW